MDPEEQNMQNMYGKQMFCAIALGALWHPLGVVSFCVCALRVLQWSLRKGQKVFKNNGLGDLFGTRFGGSIWNVQTAKAFPCSVALVSVSAGALPCSVALVLRFLMFLLVPHVGLSEGVRNVIKSLFVCLFSK